MAKTAKTAKMAVKTGAAKRATKKTAGAAAAAYAGVSDAAVTKATGRGWAEWLALLDAEGAATLPHAAIAKLVDEKFGGGDWWSQMVTVGYEQARGLRVKHQKTGGFEVSRSKTIAATPARLWRAWHEPAGRRAWLADPAITVRTAREPKSLRFTWIDGESWAEARLYPKGDKTSVTVQHGKLASLKEAERMKKYWGAQLEALAAHLTPR